MNRKQLTPTTIQFEDFAAAGRGPYVGDEVELPMNCWGSVVARFRVTATRQEGDMIIAEAVKVSK